MPVGVVAVGMMVLVGGCSGPSQTASSGSAQTGPTASQASSAPVASEPANEEADEDAPNPADLAGLPTQHLPPGPRGIIPLEVLLPVPDPSPPAGFPTPSSDDKSCTQSIGLVGRLDKDFSALASACGTNAGMKEYAKAVLGEFGPGHRYDTYQVTLSGGYCYRFFAVADGTIEKLNIRVQRENGALHSAALSKQPVVLLRPGEAWCRRRDRAYQFVVEAPETGEGRYAFGIYARPNPKGRRPPGAPRERRRP